MAEIIARQRPPSSVDYNRHTEEGIKDNLNEKITEGRFRMNPIIKIRMAIASFVQGSGGSSEPVSTYYKPNQNLKK